MDELERDARLEAIPDTHGHAKGEHKAFAEERPIPYTARMLFLWFYHACRRGGPRFMMVADHVNYLTFEDPAAVNLVRRALKLAHAGDLYGAAETAGVDVQHAAVVSEGLRRGMRYSIGAEVDNDPRNRPDAQNIVDAMRPDAIIRSVHFLTIDHAELGAGYQWAFDNPEFKHLYAEIGTEKVWELYMATLLEAIDKLPAHIIGHFYVPAKFGHWPDDETLQGYEDQLLDACAERGLAIEVNSRIFYRTYVDEDDAAPPAASAEAAVEGSDVPASPAATVDRAQAQRQRYFDVHLRLLEKAKAKGVQISVGSDAHSPRDQGGGFDAVLQMLDAADINEIAFPVNGRIARVALRATEELLRPVLPEPEPLPAVAAVALASEDDGEEDDDESVVVEVRETVVAATAVVAKPAKPARKRPSRAKPKPAAAGEATSDTEAAVAIEAVSIVETAEPDGEVVELIVVAEEVPIVEPVAALSGDPAADAGPARKRRPAKPSVTPAEAEPKPVEKPAPKPPAKVAAKAAAPPKAAPPPKTTPPPKPPAPAKPLKPAKTAAPLKPAATAKPAPSKPKPATKTVPPPKRAASSAKPAAKPAKKAGSVKSSARPTLAARPPAKKAAAKPPARTAVKKTAARPPARKAAAKPPARKAAKKSAAAPKRPAAAKPAKRGAPAKRVAAKKPAAKATAKKKAAKPRR